MQDAHPNWMEMECVFEKERVSSEEMCIDSYHCLHPYLEVQYS